MLCPLIDRIVKVFPPICLKIKFLLEKYFKSGRYIDVLPKEQSTTTNTSSPLEYFPIRILSMYERLTNCINFLSKIYNMNKVLRYREMDPQLPLSPFLILYKLAQWKQIQCIDRMARLLELVS